MKPVYLLLFLLLLLANKNVPAQNSDSHAPINRENWKKLEFARLSQPKEILSYFGEVKDGKAHGYGEAISIYKNKYVGFWANNDFHGKGKFEWNIGDVYEGNFVEGKRQGYGKYTWSNGNIYEGLWSDGTHAGKGKYMWKNGDQYEGDWVDGRRTGYGKYTFANGIINEGYFDKGIYKGKESGIVKVNKTQGTLKLSDSVHYVGEIVNGKPNGRGKISFPKGSYEGDIVDGNFHGKGKFIWPTGTIYEGDFYYGDLTGKGTLLYATGEKYVGDVFKGTKHGKGLYTTLDGIQYEGEFRNDKRNGFGKFSTPNGEIYQGNFVDNFRNGKGQMITASKDTFSGVWIQGKMDGKIKINLSSGGSEEVFYENGVLKGAVYPEFQSQHTYATYLKIQKIYQKAEEYIAQSQYNLALEEYTKVVNMDSKNAEIAYTLMGTVILKKYEKSLDRKDLTDALSKLSEAIYLNPNYQDAYYYRAAVYSDLGVTALALIDINKAIQLKPNAGQFYLIRGMIYEKMGEKLKSEQDIIKYNEWNKNMNRK